MSDDRYGDLFKKREQEREAAERRREENERRERTFDALYIQWRNELIERLRRRADEIVAERPELQQIFVNPQQDDVRVSKSYHPAGYIGIQFDRDAKALTCRFAFTGNTRSVQSEDYRAYTIALDDAGVAIELRDQYENAVDADSFVNEVFDTFMPHVIP